MDEWVDGRVGKLMDACVHGWIDKWLDAWLNG